MLIVNYKQCYEKQVVDCWNRCCWYDAITIPKFRKQALFDDNFDHNLCFVALDDEKLVGFVLATKRKFPYLERGIEPTKGWINVIFVDKEYRRKGIGTQLLNCVESSLIERGVTDIILGAYSPNYFFAGLDPIHHEEACHFFNSKGYLSGAEHFSMNRDLHGFQMSQKVLEKKYEAECKGFKFINFEYQYSLELLEFLKNEFGGGWKRNALISMQNENAEDVMLIVLDKENQICGFCMRMIDGNPMRFGPIGIAESVRNEGIGGILIEMQMYEMSKKGIYHMYFITTDEPGRRYYERHGMSVFRTFIEYRKDL
ncbi:GNAT family N-acetyltransferase [Anaerorhabdus sp.]|uniref:GNAT family N-acetyltransferase n=1 Tax=Anaerorhabdus sp. TaxID=1872524 RepID=UPI002FC69D43